MLLLQRSCIDTLRLKAPGMKSAVFGDLGIFLQVLWLSLARRSFIYET